MIQVSGLSIGPPGFEMRDVGFVVPDGSYTILMGRTGCGKTTLLEALCGLRRVRAGSITLHGRDITRAKPGERGIGYVPQDGALFPTMNLREQIGFAARLRGWDTARRARRVNALSDLLEIGHLLDRRPRGLSGGERQRVALGRALSFHPDVLLMDEPLSALDESTRQRLIGLLKRVQQHEAVTVLHVTHSRAEADALASHLLVMDNGKVAVAPSAAPATDPA